MQPSVLSNERFVLAFYGIASSPMAGKEFFQTVEQWFSAIGYHPDKLGVAGKYYGGKIANFSRSKKYLEKTGFAELQSFDMHASLPNAKVPGMEYYVSASFSCHSDDGGYAIVAVPSSFSDKHIWLPVAHNIINNLHPIYGIGYKRKLELGPVKYALGICQGLEIGLTGEAYDEARNISRWCDMGMVKQVYRKGLLRDVYPWNFLTHLHLDWNINGKSLKQWISQEDNHGYLIPIIEGEFLWEVKETHIPELRRILHDQGRIFDWKKHQ